MNGTDDPIISFSDEFFDELNFEKNDFVDVNRRRAAMYSDPDLND